jgi:hypothetical protein
VSGVDNGVDDREERLDWKGGRRKLGLDALLTAIKGALRCDVLLDGAAESVLDELSYSSKREALVEIRGVAGPMRLTAKVMVGGTSVVRTFGRVRDE